jgi:hypothetical protein
VHEATNHPQIILNNSDSIDIIRVLDSWNLFQKALCLVSDDIRLIYYKNLETDSAMAKMPMVWVYHSNFKNTFIKTTVNYQIDLDDYFNIEHFALTKWAGGIYLDTQFRKDTLQITNVHFHPKFQILMIYGLVMPLKF